MLRDLSGRFEAGLRDAIHCLVSAREGCIWSGLIIALIGTAVGLIVTYGERERGPWPRHR